MRHISINNRIFVILEDAKWSVSHIKAVRNVLNVCALNKKGLSVKLTNDYGIKELNYKWRGIKKPTNVLSFPNNLNKDKSINAYQYLGDILISYDTLKKETTIYKVPFVNHLSHILIHGILHLKGYKHDLWREENIMKKEEIRILEMLNINTAYLKRLF
ncbi:MAG: rRNA maturation RNase YbeY [Rickettsiales bacterium]|nr:rRNA maturation RNase YbeY [Rickettsiales bacterium]